MYRMQNYKTEAMTVQKGRSMDGDQNVRSTHEVCKRFYTYFRQITLISRSDYRLTYILKGTISTVHDRWNQVSDGVSSLSHTPNICGEIIRRKQFAQVQSGSLRTGTGGRLL